MEKSKSNIYSGRKTENVKLNCFGFPDDLTLIANNIKRTKSHISSLQEIAQRIGLKISYGKKEC